jgi:cytochrome c-type biogenesis protein CcmF
MLSWKRADLGAVLARLKAAAAIAAAAAGLTWAMADGSQVLAALGMALAAWLVAGTMLGIARRITLFQAPFARSLTLARNLPRSTWGMSLAHASLGIMVAGITASSAWQTESLQMMRAGDATVVAGYRFAFGGAVPFQGPNYSGWRGSFTVTKDGTPIARLTPEKRQFPAERSATTEAAIHAVWSGDLYAVLGEQAEGGAWSVRIYHNPLVSWIWIGMVLMACGGMISLSDRRHRVGAPRRALAAAPA